MKERTHRLIAAMLLALFVTFIGGNTLCVHTHVGPKGIVTHSHPYLPSSQHSHTASQFDSLAAVNSLSFDNSDAPAAIAGASPAVCRLEAPSVQLTWNTVFAATPDRRGPPAYA